MDTVFLITLALLGLGGGFLSGLLGLGGAMFMIPLLFYVPPLLGVGVLDMKEIAAISMVQVLAASLSGMHAHSRNKFVSRQLLLYLGAANAIGNLAGSVWSKYAGGGSLLGIFASLAIVAGCVMFIPKPEVEAFPDARNVRFNKSFAAAFGLVVGFFGGMVGAPGAFAYIPFMIYVLGVPTRITIGSTLGIVFLGAVTGTLGKALTGQVIWPYALALVAGTIPGAQLGGRMSRRVNTIHLRYAIAVVFAVMGIRMWYQVLTGR